MIAFHALVYELEQNRNWVKQFINDFDVGAHKGKTDKNILTFSWIWNPPQIVAYESYLNLVCGNDEKLAIKIINLYSRLESCKIIVHFIHELIINNAGEKIIEYNERLSKICVEIKDSFIEPIEKLKIMKENSSFNKTTLLDHRSLLPTGTGTFDPAAFAFKHTASTCTITSTQSKEIEEETNSEASAPLKKNDKLIS